MAAGCYVIATPNAGAPLLDGVAARIVRPGDSAGIRRELDSLASNPSLTREQGYRNAQIIRSLLTESTYRAGLSTAYSSFLSRRIRTT
jgi:hypothetical protein